MPSPPPSSQPVSPPGTPTHRQPLNPLDGSSLLPSSPAPAPNNNNVPPLANGSPPLSGSASPAPPPAPPSPELAFSNDQILSMMRPLVRVLQQRGVLDRLPPSPPSPPKFPEPSVCTTTGTGTAGVPHSLTTKHEGSMPPSRYVAINMKTALQNKSLEELRLEDYNLAKAIHPLSTAQNPSLANHDHQSSFNTAPGSRTLSFTNPFTNPPASPKAVFSNSAPAANSFGPVSNQLKLPWLPNSASNNAPSFDLHPLFSPFSFPSSSQPTYQQPNSQTFAKTNNSNTYATNWLSNDPRQTLPTSFKPHDGQSAFANAPRSFSFPSAPQSAPNGAASSFGPPPVHNSFAPASKLTMKRDGDGAAAANNVMNGGFNVLGSTGYSQTVTQRQTFTTPAGENHGPVFNEIQVSQTAYFPQGWFC